MSFLFGTVVLSRFDLLDRLLVSVCKSHLQPSVTTVVVNGPVSGFIDRRSAEVLVPKENAGCAGGWNLLIERARSLKLPYVIIANDDVELDEHALANIHAGLVMESADLAAGHGFSLFGMRTALVDEVGWFDENFFPAYFEDNDFAYRLKLAGKKSIAVPTNIIHEGSATLKSMSPAARREFDMVYGKLQTYYASKWGRTPKRGERFKAPFNGKPPKGWRERPRTG